MKSSCIILIILLPLLGLSQNRYDVVIDEIMADPVPAVGLPNVEWIELKNISSSPVQLEGWHLSDAAGQSGAFPNVVLQPDSFLIVCSASALPAISTFGNAISITGFPSLGNEGDEISLAMPAGGIMHAVEYSNNWYRNEVKQNGGWSLEMIDPGSPCVGSDNWRASVDPSGGTPGRRNSVNGTNLDQNSPALKSAYLEDSLTIIAVFSEPIDSVEGATAANYSISGGLLVMKATTLGPLFNTVRLRLSSAPATDIVYNLSANRITDCSKNVIGSAHEVKIGMPAQPSFMDIVINEILYNPRDDGYDYVEFFNKSNKIVDVANLFVANRNASGDLSSIAQIEVQPHYIFPGDYLVITENSASLQRNYLVENPGAVIEMSHLPSYPDDHGAVILIGRQGDIIDEVRYAADWQFRLIANVDGVSLERIDPAGPSQDPGNWHSAASTAGYGTPTYRNSQYRQIPASNVAIQVTPQVFSPDNDGYDDIAEIQYTVGVPGYVINITIFDSEGRPVRYLLKNFIAGSSGRCTWDGLDDKGNRLPIGIYILYTEMFNLEGNRMHFRNVVVLAQRL